MITLTTGIIFLLFTCMHFWVWGILRRWSVCDASAYEVVRDCRMFENTAVNHLYKIHFNIILPHPSQYFKWLLSNNFPTKILYSFHACPFQTT
jgi:hypothetical protein